MKIYSRSSHCDDMQDIPANNQRSETCPNSCNEVKTDIDVDQDLCTAPLAEFILDQCENTGASSTSLGVEAITQDTSLVDVIDSQQIPQTLDRNMHDIATDLDISREPVHFQHFLDISIIGLPERT